MRLSQDVIWLVSCRLLGSFHVDPETRELKPRTLDLTPEARKLPVVFADEIEAAQAPGGDPAHITGAASKAAEQAARIAGVLTLWRDPGAATVEARDMGDAIRLAEFYLSEASRLASAAMVSAEIDRAETLRRWLLESWPHPEIVKSEVVPNGPSALRETKLAGQALDVLATHGAVGKQSFEGFSCNSGMIMIDLSSF